MIISDAGSAGRFARAREPHHPRTRRHSPRDENAQRRYEPDAETLSISSKSSLRATLNPPSRWISCTNNVRRFDSLIKRGVVEARQLAPPTDSCVNLSSTFNYICPAHIFYAHECVCTKNFNDKGLLILRTTKESRISNEEVMSIVRIVFTYRTLINARKLYT